MLRTQRTGRVVQFGIVRINRSQLPANVMQLIEDQVAPLGRILIDHQIMRNVKRLSLWQIEAGREMQLAFESSDQETLIRQLAESDQESSDSAGVSQLTCYGRTAFLYLDSLPVVELLEIVKV